VIAGLDANLLCYVLDKRYPEHEKVKAIVLDLSAESKVALNPTIIHETYHTLVFSQKWTPEEAAEAIKVVLKNPFIEFFNQTRKISIIALNISVRHNLGGRDSLIVANFLSNQTPIMLTHDKALLKIQKMTWKSENLIFKDPLTEG